MQSEYLDAVLIEMDRVRDRIEELRRVQKEVSWGHQKYEAAIRRSSMDLTRVLAKLRGA